MLRIVRFVRFLPLLAVVVLAAVPSRSAEGRTPVWVDGTVIGTDGAYIVTRDIAGAGGTPVITVTAPNVTLDLNGFTLTQPGGFPVIDLVGPAVEITIRNGKLVGGSEGINLATGAIVRTVIVENVELKDTAGDAIHLEEVRTVEIRNNQIADVAGTGISVTGGTTFKNGHIDGNSIHFTGGDGIFIEHTAAVSVRHNRIEVPSADGISASDSLSCLVGENLVSDADGFGIVLGFSRACKVFNNIVNRGETGGILIDPGSEDNLVLDNVVRESGLGGAAAFPGAGGYGLTIDGRRNHVERNTVNLNDGCGIFIGGTGNTFGRNMARGNDPSGSFFCGGVACGALFPPDSCDASGVGNNSFGDNFIPVLF